MTFSAVLYDSMREVLDARTTKVLITVSTAILAVCLSIRVERQTPEQTLQSIVDDLQVPVALKGKRLEPEDDPKVRLDAIRPLTAQDSDRPEFAGGWRLLLSVGNPEAFAKRVKIILDSDRDPNAEDGERYLIDRFVRKGVPHVKAWVMRERLRFSVYVGPTDWDEVSRGAKVSLLFGTLPWPAQGLSLAHSLVQLQGILAIFVAGGAWVLVALIWCAGIVPAMLARGSVDLLLAKPVSRVSLLLYKFLGGLLFIALHATYLIGTTWAALAWRFDWWNPGYLWTIIAVIWFFAILYSVSVLAGVVSRNVVAPILAPFAVWFWCWLLWVERGLEAEGAMQVPERLSRLLNLLHLLSPRASDLNNVTMWFLARGRTSESLILDLELDRSLDFGLILASSSAFVLLVLALSCWIFSRRDY